MNSNNNPQASRKIYEAKIKAHINIGITPDNMFYKYNKIISIPPNIKYNDFKGWLNEYVLLLSDDDLIVLMDNLGIHNNVDIDKWNGVFVIHSSTDLMYARAITKGLNSINIPDSKIYCSSVEECGTEIGESFHEIIKVRIHNASVAICILSEAILKSSYCHQEVGAFMALNVPIIPILINGFDPEYMPGFMDKTRYEAVVNIGSQKGSEKFLSAVAKRYDIDVNQVDMSKGVQSIVTTIYGGEQ